MEAVIGWEDGRLKYRVTLEASVEASWSSRKKYWGQAPVSAAQPS